MRHALIPLLLVATPALADEAPRTLRLLGETQTVVATMPTRFVVDATLEDGYDGATAQIDEGWFAPLDGEAPVQGELSGTCIEERCAFTVGDLTITGDILAAGPVTAKFTVKAYDEVKGTGTVRLTPFGDTVPGLGKLAPPGAITGAELSRLLLWRGHASGFFSIDDDPPDDFQREPLAAWQAERGRPGGGLILESDLAALRAEVAKAQAEAGWKDGYPSAWLRSLSASAHPGERRYASDDGKVTLVIAADPSLTDEGWDAFVDKLTGDDNADGRDGYTRVNDEMEIRHSKGGAVTVAAYKHAETALYRMILSYPEDQEARWGPLAGVLQYELRARK